MKQRTATLRLYNASKQALRLQVRPPGGDFFTSEQQVTLNPGQQVNLIKTHVNMDQVQNLQKRGMIKIVYDSEA